jgi:hypothetical protein
MHRADEAERLKTRNRAFGAGMATGVATPRILRGLYDVANAKGLIAPPPPWENVA